MTDRELLEKILGEIGNINTRTGKLEDSMEKLGAEVQAVKTEMQTVKTEVQTVKTEVQKIQVTQEVKVLPGLSLLAEGHENILEHIDEKISDRTEDLQDQVDALRITVKQHSREIRELKKAQ